MDPFTVVSLYRTVLQLEAVYIVYICVYIYRNIHIILSCGGRHWWSSSNSNTAPNTDTNDKKEQNMTLK